MGRIDETHARLLAAADTVELELAQGLLAEAGIPSLAHGPDFDIAELGHAVHDALRRRDLFVPRERLDEAREVLRAAWGHLGRSAAED